MNLPRDLNFPMPTGWQCPVCFAVMSPSIPSCFHCVPLKEGEFRGRVCMKKDVDEDV
jgi:hypothetical protein